MSETASHLADLRPLPPFIWPDARTFTGRASYSTTPPFEPLLADADLISGVVVGASDGTIQWLERILKEEGSRRISLVIVVFPAALGGGDVKNVHAFIAARRASIRNDLNEMYARLGQGKEVPADKLAAVLNEVEERITQALNTRITPRLVFNRIAAPDLTASAPDANWSQPFSLLLRTAHAMRKPLIDPFFPRQFSGMDFGEREFRGACNPFGDHMADSQDFTRAREESDELQQIEGSDHPLKEKCCTVWQIIKGEVGPVQ